MHSQPYLAAVAFAVLTRALPLNINLGAYSPALVVGDGAISFEEGNAAQNLIGALQGATVATAGATARPATEAAATATTNEGAAVAPAVDDSTTAAGTTTAAASEQAASEPLNGMGRAALLLPRASEAREVEVGEGEEERQDGGQQRRRRDSATVQKRQSGFDRALQFAEAALTKGPTIELGTGEGGSGVGISVDNTPTAARANA